jgi:hypothetical protein
VQVRLDAEHARDRLHSPLDRLRVGVARYRTVQEDDVIGDDDVNTWYVAALLEWAEARANTSRQHVVVNVRVRPSASEPVLDALEAPFGETNTTIQFVDATA